MFWLKKYRRKRAAQRPFPSEWIAIIERNVPTYHRLPPQDQVQLQRHVLVFLAEKYFEGCKNLKITDEVRITISAWACFLLLHRQTDYYPGLRSIVVYPSSFVVPEVRRHVSNLIVEGPEERLGEAWPRGPVVLSWEDVLYNAEDPRDGQNVVLHEFAHQIDATWGKGDSSEVLADRTRFVAWTRVMNREFRTLQRDVEQDRDTFLDEYGATDPAEFFSVATEHFFEQPREMDDALPELYQAMSKFYHQDPAREWDWHNLQ
jgi:MtfA peptidase